MKEPVEIEKEPIRELLERVCRTTPRKPRRKMKAWVEGPVYLVWCTDHDGDGTVYQHGFYHTKQDAEIESAKLKNGV